MKGRKVSLAESAAYANAQMQENVKDVQDGWNVAYLGADGGHAPEAAQLGRGEVLRGLINHTELRIHP